MITSTKDFQKNATGKSKQASVPSEAVLRANKIKSDTQSAAFASALAAWKDNTIPYKGYYLDGASVIKPEFQFNNLLTRITNVTKNVYCNGAMGKIDNFFKNTNNWKSVVDAYIKFGMVSGSYKNGTFFRSSECNTSNIVNFYNYASTWADLSLKYPPLDTAKKNNCYFLKEALVKFEAEKSNISTLYGNQSSQYNALIDKISEYNAYDSQMTCGQYIVEQDKAELKKQIDILGDKAQKTARENFEIATGDDDEDKTKKYITYGAVGLAAVVFLVVLVKKLKK